MTLVALFLYDAACRYADLCYAECCGAFVTILIGLHHPLDGVTNPEYKLLCFIQITIFLQREEGTSF